MKNGENNKEFLFGTQATFKVIFAMIQTLSIKITLNYKK